MLVQGKENNNVQAKIEIGLMMLVNVREELEECCKKQEHLVVEG